MDERLSRNQNMCAKFVIQATLTFQKLMRRITDEAIRKNEEHVHEEHSNSTDRGEDVLIIFPVVINLCHNYL